MPRIPEDVHTFIVQRLAMYGAPGESALRDPYPYPFEK